MKHHIIAMMAGCILVAAVLTGCKTSADETAAVKPDTIEATKPPELQTSLHWSMSMMTTFRNL